MKHYTVLRVVCLVFLCLLCTVKGQALCTLSCNDQVQISLDADGIAVVLPDMILDGGETSCPGPKTVNAILPFGTMIGDTITCVFVNELLNVRVTDNATGNYCWGTILVEDKLPPILSCQDTTVHCTADLSVDSIGYPLISDNCDLNPDTSYFEDTAIELCNTPNSAILTRTWYVVDASNNSSLPCVQVVTVVRPDLTDVEFPLNFDNVQQSALSCSNADTSIIYTGMPMIDSISIGSLCKITCHYDDLVLGACGLSYSVLRQWSVLDCCSGEIITHDQIIKVEDDQPPVFDCPDTLVFKTNGPGCAGTFFLPALPVSDNCSGVKSIRTIIPKGTIEGNGGLVFGLPMGDHFVTYEAFDWCGNVAHCSVVVTVEDQVAPVAVCDEITKVSLTSGGNALVPATSFDDGSYDECCAVSFLVKRMDDSNAPFLPDVMLDCNDVGDSTMVIVQVSDCYGNSNTCMVSVLTNDKLAPEITCPPDITLACTEWIPAPLSLTGEPNVWENCEVDTLFFTDQENLNTCHTGFITRTFTVLDEAGFSDQCSHTIHLIDTTQSTFIFPADTLTDCGIPLDSISAGDVMALGDCEAWALSVSDETYPIPCGLKIFRTYTFLEWCSGVDTSYTQFIEVRDTNPPVWDQPVGANDTSYVCPGDLVKPPPPTATDFCSTDTVILVKDTIIFMGCPNKYVQTFTYHAYDTCGNMAEPFLVNIFVNDTIPPSAPLRNRYFGCLDEIPPFDSAAVNAEDNCLLSLKSVDLVAEDTTDNGCTGTVVRTYLLSDNCNNTALVAQNFIWQDTVPPSVTAPPLGPFPCLENVPDTAEVTYMAMDNCQDMVFADHIKDSTNVINCSGLLWRTWRFSDACGNDTLVTQLFTVLDTIAPEINCTGSQSVVLLPQTCERQVSVDLGAQDNCMDTGIVITNNFDNGNGSVDSLLSPGTYPITFFASDICGNRDSCLITITVTDTFPPTNQCGLIEASLEGNGEYVLNFDSLLANGILGGEDFCGEVTYTTDLDSLLDCFEYIDYFVDTLGLAVIDYTLTVTDVFGNDSTCIGNIFLSDPQDYCEDDSLVVGGLVFNEAHDPMPNVETRLIDGSAVKYSMTSQQGWYHFSGVPSGATCMLKPSKDDDLRNGVTTYDLIKISKHILGEEILDSPYKLIAADANHSGAVTTFDVVLIRKVILYVENEFPNNTSWRFIRADYAFPDASNPFAEPIPEEAWINNITQDVYGYHFIGIKVGDVNGSAQVNFRDVLENRGGEEITLSAQDKWLRQGETIEVPIWIREDITLEAIQATLAYDPEKLNFKSLIPAGINLQDTDYAQPRSGSVTLAWDTPDGRSLRENDIVFRLQFQVLESTFLSEVFTMNSTLTPTIAYKNGGNPLNVNWRIHVVPHTTPVDVANFFRLAQNRPNPFAEETKVLFYLNETMPVRLEVVDMAGRKISILDRELDAGWQEATIGRQQLGSNGIYFYQLITPFGSEQRKMVFND